MVEPTIDPSFEDEGALLVDSAQAPDAAIAAIAPEAPTKARSHKRRGSKGKSGKTSPPSQSPPPPPPPSYNTPEEELLAMDDWGSAWEQCKATGRRWGGRAFGGREAGRKTFQPKDVSLEGVTLDYLGNHLLDRTTLKLVWQHRYGLVGRNGVGKTTLFRRIATSTLPGFPLHLRVHLVEQQPNLDLSKTPVQLVVESDREYMDLQAESEELEALDLTDEQSTEEISSEQAVARLEEIHVRLDEIEAHDIEARATRLLEQLGFNERMMAAPAEALSGGWRARLALARGLFGRADVLLLDEPTNHLDLHGILWLQSYLLEHFKGTLVVISHDRAFLDAVCTDVMLMYRQQLQYYPGNYAAFEKAKADHDLRMHRAEEELERGRKHMEDSIKRMERAAGGSKGDQKKQTQIASRKKKLERHGLEFMPNGERFQAIKHGYRPGSVAENAGGWVDGKASRRGVADYGEAEVKFSFKQPLGLGRDVLMQMRDVAFAYTPEGPAVLQGLNLTITRTTRMTILGKNGCGKTTLLRLLSGDAYHGDEGGALTPTSGEIIRHKDLRVGVFTQHHQQQLPRDVTCVEHLASLFPRAKESELRAVLGSFGLSGDKALQRIGSLSGGQQSRVAFAALTFEPPDILVLDEPTNHLDIDTIAALTTAIKGYLGAVVLVSHDRRVVAEVGGDLWQLRKPPKGLQRLECTYDDYVARTQRRLSRVLGSGTLDLSRSR